MRQRTEVRLWTVRPGLTGCNLEPLFQWHHAFLVTTIGVRDAEWHPELLPNLCRISASISPRLADSGSGLE